MGNECVQYVGHCEVPKDSPCVFGTVGRDGQWGLSVFSMPTVDVVLRGSVVDQLSVDHSNRR